MISARHSPLLAAGFLLSMILGPPRPGSAQDPSSGTPPTTQHAAIPGDAPALADDLRARIRAARVHRDRQARRAAFEAVVPLAEQLATHQPGAEASELLAVARLGAGRYRESQETARRWVAQSPRDWIARHTLGMSLNATEDYEAALAPLQRAMELAPPDMRNRLVARSLGFALEKLRRLEDAFAVYRSAGDERSAARVRENMETLASASAIDAGIVCVEPELLREEAERLEKELAALGF